MNWNVDVRTQRTHTAGIDEPVVQEATIELFKPVEGDANSQATLTDFRGLLTTAVNNLNIPGTANILEGIRVSLKWS